MSSIRLPRPSALGGIALAVLAIAAAPAAATVTSSQIDSVTTPDGFAANPVGGALFSSWDGDVSPSQTTVVSGHVTTDDGNASDLVDVRCYYGDGGEYDNIDSGVTVNPDGTFTTSPSTFEDETCHMSAVDSSYSNPADFSTFQGPVYGVGYRSSSQIGGGPNDGTTYDYFTDGHQSKGYMEWDSAGDCGITWSQVFDSTYYDYDDYSPFDCAGAMYTSDNGDGYGRSEVQVDGRNALNSYGAQAVSYYDGSTWHYGSQNANFPALTWTNQVDPASGDMTVTESENLVGCGDNSLTALCDPATPYTFQGTGVRFDRTAKQSKDGLQATVTDTYTSTDGAQHAIDVEYDNYSDEDDSIVYDVPGSSGFKPYCDGDTVELPAQAVGSIYVRDVYYGDGNPEYQIPGAFTYLTQPDRMFFNSGCSSSYGEFVLQYKRTVPAGGSVSITHVYTQAADTQHVRELAGQAEDAAQAPTVSIASPVNGATIHSTDVTVTGSAADDSGAPSLRVNGVPTAVNPDGSWSQHVTLASGSNTITAVASDAAGNQSQAQTTVVEAGGCTVPNVVDIPTAQAIAGLHAANCAVGRQTAVVDAHVRTGNVATQSAAPGSSIPSSTPVDLGISTGAVAKVALAHKRVRLHHRRLVIKVACPTGSPVITGTVRLRTMSGRHRTLGTRAFQCPAGKRRSVRFRLSKANARRLHRHHNNPAAAYIVGRNSAGESTTNVVRMTIVGRKKK